ncbi:hypothetical protein Ahy_B07g087388 isoform D [Arachis hypogaea]|uniref:Aminotransferase-like plant mobile domain-containing protein n=1 Tax=Arachis hypogaea TaxID=3818 RepID=A0A444YC22_ARAHY|nr:hypothetical protein Ahy_B07g087388 isoform D [Arachis hypogaea]
MPLHDRIIPYLERVGLYHLARLNSEWFWLDEPLVSAFVERWRPETHTFHLPFGECTVTLQDVAFQLGLPVDGFRDRFRVLPVDASEETVRIYTRAYIMMMLSTQLFGDKSANRVHIRWLPFVANLDDMGRYSWGSAALAWLYRCMCRVANRNVTNLTGPLQLLQSWIFWRFPSLRPEGFEAFSFPLASRYVLYFITVNKFLWRFYGEPYSALDVLAVVHPEILTEEHSRLWRAVTSLIYFAVIEWHQVDRVVPQLGGVQHIPEDALNVDWLHAKDRKGGDRWFPHYYQVWHLHWGGDRWFPLRSAGVSFIHVVADAGGTWSSFSCPSHAWVGDHCRPVIWWPKPLWNTR